MSSTDAFLIRNARIVCPVTGADFLGSVSIVDGRIHNLIEGGDGPAHGKIIEANGAVLTTGFTELYARSGEPGREDTGDLETLSASALRGGFTTVCVSPLTQPCMDTRSDVEYVRRRSSEIGGAQLQPIGC